MVVEELRLLDVNIADLDVHSIDGDRTDRDMVEMDCDASSVPVDEKVVEERK